MSVTEREPMSTEYEIFTRLKKDVKTAAVTLTGAEARYLVDLYYTMQEHRIATAAQGRSLDKGGEPHAAIAFFEGQMETLEHQVKSCLDVYSDSQPLGQWSRKVVGVGPVLAAGLLAHIDLTKAPTVGHIWRYAGLDPTCKWEKKTKRPWNAQLKVLCVLPTCHVTTKRGYLPIAEVNVGDEVLTHLGRWRKVTQVFVNKVQGKLYGLHADNSGNQVAWLTGEHPVYAAEPRIWEEWSEFKVTSAPPFSWHGIQDISERWILSRPVIADRVEAGSIHVNSRHDKEVRARTTLTTLYDGEVFNLEVEEDHSYIVEGYAVHNCWKTGESFVKVCGRDDAFYGHIYSARKIQEQEKNEAGLFAEAAKAALAAKKYRDDTKAKACYEAGKLPPAHVHARAKRYAVKLFLAHYWQVGREMAGLPVPLPYPIAHMGHAHVIPPP